MYEGAYGRIISTGLDTVAKIPHRRVPKGSLSLDEQKAIHAAVLQETTSYTVLTAPRLVHSDRYEMARIDVEKIIFLGCQGNVVEVNTALLVSELATLWRALYKKGYIAWDFELYLQPDGRVAMVDFDKFKKASVAGLEDELFVHPCFPRGFKDIVLYTEGRP